MKWDIKFQSLVGKITCVKWDDFFGEGNEGAVNVVAVKCVKLWKLGCRNMLSKFMVEHHHAESSKYFLICYKNIVAGHPLSLRGSSCLSFKAMPPVKRLYYPPFCSWWHMTRWPNKCNRTLKNFMKYSWSIRRN